MKFAQVIHLLFIAMFIEIHSMELQLQKTEQHTLYVSALMCPVLDISRFDTNYRLTYTLIGGNKESLFWAQPSDFLMSMSKLSVLPQKKERVYRLPLASRMYRKVENDHFERKAGDRILARSAEMDGEMWPE
jgi:hypothetical protein